MSYLIALVIGFAAGGLSLYILTEHKQRLLRKLQERLLTESRNNTAAAEANSRRHGELETQSTRLQQEIASFNSRAVSYGELRNENTVLKSDLRNIAIATRKIQLDSQSQQVSQQESDRRSQALAEKYLNDNLRWVRSTLTQNNFAICKQRLLSVISWCREIGFVLPAEEEAEMLAALQAGFEKAVRVAVEREEQARIRAQIREEQRVEREREQEILQAEAERRAIQEALDRALQVTRDEHSAEIEALQTKLAEAEARSQRAISQAQLTKAGHVYVISNIGSFGQDVFKVGMTRRSDPMDRVEELGDASVPFPFDVHMMISCDDAPKLENALHRELHLHRINRVNPRKEFFRIDIETIRDLVERNHGVVKYEADPEALQYHQSLSMTDQDQEFIDSVYESVEPEADLDDDDQ